MYDFFISTFRTAREFIFPYLTNYQAFSKGLSAEVEGVERGNNIQYSFDVKLDNIIKEQIERYGLEGKVFSEESGFYTVGDKNEYRIVFDPFCNSTLASRGFLNGACGISVFSWDYRLIASGILDYQTGVMALLENDKTKFFDIQSDEEVGSERKSEETLDTAWVAMALESKSERDGFDKIAGIFQRVKKLDVNSGHIYWLRLAMGTIDAYLDPTHGEKLYEMFAASVAQGAGCTVTDCVGEIFDPGKYLKFFEANPEYRYCHVAARTPELHAQILSLLKS